jgi:hypothetical protein
MRTTWLILLLMVAAGAGMYFMANRKKSLSSNETIAIINTPDSIRKKIRLFAAYQPADVLYADSAWHVQDSVLLKEINLDSATNTFDKDYQSATFFIDYDHSWFYDVEINKPKANAPYQLQFAVQPSGDQMIVTGDIDDQEGKVLRVSGPMVKMYKAFVLTYNSRIPQQEKDTSNLVDTSGIMPSKTITVLKN